MAEARRTRCAPWRPIGCGSVCPSTRILPRISWGERPSFANRFTPSARRSGVAQIRRKPRSPVFPVSMPDLWPKPSLRPASRRAAGCGACALRRSKPRWVRSRSQPSACSLKVIFTASENARATLAAGCSMIAARTTAGGGVRWGCAAIAPSSGDWRRGGAGLEPSPGHSPTRSYGRRNARRLFAGAGDGPGEALPHGAAGAHGRWGPDRHSGANA